MIKVLVIPDIHLKFWIIIKVEAIISETSWLSMSLLLQSCS